MKKILEIIVEPQDLLIDELDKIRGGFASISPTDSKCKDGDTKCKDGDTDSSLLRAL